MAKKMVIDGVVYVAKEEYDKEIVERKAKELGGIEEKALIEAMLKARGYAFSRIVKEVAKKKITDIGYFDIFDETEDYDGKELQKKLAIVALVLQD
ncbi:hypothetical protein FKN04_12770 [Bacillus glycinifermentans]|uniref:hypothetical protein n=1 Tax=Bacillus glycinifermentans TaxID=1664069 RepID=UPI00158234DA|nr:hypothetical protein [Bacillus glycinifermentans]NUJ17448.1 hypothetical protein [Bacillus glycinifermentans]